MVEAANYQGDTMDHIGGGIIGGMTNTVGGGRVSSCQLVKRWVA